MGTNPSSIDHIITNMTSLFMKSCTAETGISDYHKLIMSFYRMTYAKSKGKKLFCCCFKNFNSKFLKEVLIKICLRRSYLKVSKPLLKNLPF